MPGSVKDEEERKIEEPSPAMCPNMKQFSRLQVLMVGRPVLCWLQEGWKGEGDGSMQILR